MSTVSEQPKPTVQRVSVTLMVEAEGYDVVEAGTIASRAIMRALRAAAVDDSELGSTAEASCDSCGARAGVTKRGKVRSHSRCETYRAWRDEPACDGSGKAPHVSNEPVISMIWPNGHRFDVRIKDAMETGMAAGNGYLWTHVTAKSFR